MYKSNQCNNLITDNPTLMITSGPTGYGGQPVGFNPNSGMPPNMGMGMAGMNMSSAPPQNPAAGFNFGV